MNRENAVRERLDAQAGQEGRAKQAVVVRRSGPTKQSTPSSPYRDRPGRGAVSAPAGRPQALRRSATAPPGSAAPRSRRPTSAGRLCSTWRRMSSAAPSASPANTSSSSSKCCSKSAVRRGAGAPQRVQALAAVAVGAIPQQVEGRGQQRVVRRLPERRVEAAVDVDRALVGLVVERLELPREVLQGVALLGRDRAPRRGARPATRAEPASRAGCGRPRSRAASRARRGGRRGRRSPRRRAAAAPRAAA